jgi:cytochrome P450
VAGHETTATLLSWILYRLCLNPDVQSALRAECRANPLSTDIHGNDPFTQDELTMFDKLPLLDAVVRETLRLDAPVTGTGRAAAKDDLIPLSKPFVDVNGVMRDAVPVSKGDSVLIPIVLVNRSEELWGADAKEWKRVLFFRFCSFE